MKKKRKIIIGFLLGLMVASVGLVVIQKNKPLRVSSLTITPSKHEEYIVEEGSVETWKKQAITSPESEKIVALKVEEGQRVEAGDLLLILDRHDLEYDLQTLMAEVESLEGQSLSETEVIDSRDVSIQAEVLKKARRDLADKKKMYEANGALFNSGGISENAYLDSKDDYNDAMNTDRIESLKLEDLKEAQKLGTGKKQYYEGQTKALNLKIQQLEERLQALEVKAPISGYVSGIDLNVGDYLQEEGHLFDIVNPDHLYVEAYVDTKVAKLLKLDDKVILEVADQNDYRKVDGHISAIATVAQEIISPLGLIEKKVKVKISVADQSLLIVGEAVDVDFITFSGQDVLVLPRDYTFPWQGKKGFWVIEEGVATIRLIDPLYESISKVMLEGTEALTIITPPYSEALEEGVEVEWVQ
jgi:HlyD family secretion protein